MKFVIFNPQAFGRRGWRAVGGPARRGAAGGTRVARFDLHPPTGYDETQGRREAQVPLGRPRHQGRDFRRSDLQAGHQHSSHAVSPGSRQSSQGETDNLALLSNVWVSALGKCSFSLLLEDSKLVVKLASIFLVKLSTSTPLRLFGQKILTYIFKEFL